MNCIHEWEYVWDLDNATVLQQCIKCMKVRAEHYCQG